MNKETTHKNIAAALAAAQSEMGKAYKDSKNPHFKSTYADLASVMGACMPALNANGIAVVQPFFDDETGRYIKTILVHGESGETLECRVPLIVNKNDMQGFGSAATYARRYGLMAMAGIAPEDDDGHAAAKNPPKDETPKSAPPNLDAQKEINDAINQLISATELNALRSVWLCLPKHLQAQRRVIDAKDARKAEIELTAAPNDDLGGDEIPTFEPAGPDVGDGENGAGGVGNG